MSQESFEKEFSALRELGSSHFVLRGSTLIVEIMPEEELKTKSGLYIGSVEGHVKGGSVSQNKLEVGRVLMKGEGYWNEEKNSYEDVGLEVGAVVVLPQYSIQVISMFPGIQRPTGNKLALVKFDSVLAHYPTREAFEAAKAKLNS